MATIVASLAGLLPFYHSESPGRSLCRAAVRGCGEKCFGVREACWALFGDVGPSVLAEAGTWLSARWRTLVGQQQQLATRQYVASAVWGVLCGVQVVLAGLVPVLLSGRGRRLAVAVHRTGVAASGVLFWSCHAHGLPCSALALQQGFFLFFLACLVGAGAVQ